jgi:hypothetical protein
MIADCRLRIEDLMWQDAKSTSNDMEKVTLPFRAMAWLWPGLLILAVFGAPCFGQAPITNGLVARWSGDGNANDSAGHSDGRVSGGLRYVPGPAGRAFQFDGAGAKVDFGNSAGNFGTRDFTIAYWMKTDSKEREEAFLCKRAACDGGNIFWNIRIGGPATPPGAPKLELCDPVRTTALYLFTSRPMNDGQWRHIAWVRQSTSSGSSRGLVYVDGALDTSVEYPETVDISNQLPLVLGQDVCQNRDGTRPYSGAAAELQIFSHALSAEEILTLYKAGKSGK